ncbi:MAG: N-acetyl-gamma-glutamyl-phosphate reductase [Bacillota bacterium]|nr:N-acetyl-gamma-glutamyl-phosphate reductase [Bacillota bacterium]
MLAAAPDAGRGADTGDGQRRLKVSIAGGSGYVGGELLRLLLAHPRVEVAQVTSRRLAGRFVHQAHPNLRRQTMLQFVPPEALEPCDLLFVSMPHGEGLKLAETLFALAPRVIDLSADHRLRQAGDYPLWYGWEHPAPRRLESFVYGLPELHRAEIAGAMHVSGTGCMAAAAIIGLWPLFRHGLVENDPVVIEGKFGSSAGGADPSPAGHHPERASVIRTYEPVGHRHTAEIAQELGAAAAATGAPASFPPKVHLTATAVDAVRGLQCCCHVFLKDPALEERDIWRVYREAYGREPFIRLVKERHGAHRYPDPKVMAGSNYCDVGFACDPHSRRLVVIAALDNLMKGAAGNGVQSMNVMMGWPEVEGLTFAGLHPC